MNSTEVSVVVTGSAWLGSGTGSVESALYDMLGEATREVVVTAYSVTSGANSVLSWTKDVLDRGISTTLVINRLDTQRADVVSRLKQLAGEYNYFYLYDFVAPAGADLHAKCVVVDRKVALVGSSNLSWRGLVTNHELALLLRGEAATSVAAAIDKLLSSRLVIRVGQ